MFKDYYKILNIDPNSNLEEIKKAFKEEALKWHPDRNKDVDTTFKMQDINEAYIILRDIEAREKYDKEYIRRNKKHISSENQFDDKVLKKWVENARNQAYEITFRTINEVSELSVSATKKAGLRLAEALIGYFIILILALIIFKTCT